MGKKSPASIRMSRGSCADEKNGNMDAKDYSDAQHVSNLVILIGRLVHQVRRFDESNGVAEKAMDYLRRSDLRPSILRGVTENVMERRNQT